MQHNLRDMNFDCATIALEFHPFCFQTISLQNEKFGMGNRVWIPMLGEIVVKIFKYIDKNLLLAMIPMITNI